MFDIRRKAWQMELAFLLAAGSVIAQNTSAPNTQNNSAAPSLPTSWPAAVNPHATPEARALLQLIDSITGHSTLTGQHNFPNSISRWTDRAYDLTGKYPALFGQDFGFSGGEDKDSVQARPEMIAEAERQYAHGAVVALTWHAVRPTDDEPVSFHDSVQGHLSDFEWHELLTPGTDLNKRWCAQVDLVAGYLRQLQDAHVPVLFRAYHEMNGNWFWWGGRPGQNGSAALYRQIYDRFVNLHHLDNIVWVWNVNTPSQNAGSIADYYPGPQYVDVLTIDIYGAFNTQYYTDMLALAAGKPIAMGEVGTAPTPEILAAQPRWAYFMVWSNLVDFSNNVDALTALYHSPQVLTRDDSAIAEPMQAIRQTTATRAQGKPEIEAITPDTSEPAKALLARLYGAASTGTLSGQENSPQAVTAATTAVTEATGKTPLIYGEELGITSDAAQEPATARRAIVEEAKLEHERGALIALTWHALRPTDDSPASDAKSVRGALTDFEWDQLLTQGSDLNKRWCEQVDDVAETLRALQDARIAVLWQPYPEANGRTYWWAGRKGLHGSAELYRQLYRRLVDHDHLRNLIWVWQAAAPGFGPNGPGPLNDYFPGLLYVDALAVSTQSAGNGRFRTDALLARLGVGKPIGIELSGTFPAPDFFTQQNDWAWFLAGASAPMSQAPAMTALYGDARIVSLKTGR
jgi:mannan endo-1,4-beta-mannosidase